MAKDSCVPGKCSCTELHVVIRGHQGSYRRHSFGLSLSCCSILSVVLLLVFLPQEAHCEVDGRISHANLYPRQSPGGRRIPNSLPERGVQIKRRLSRWLQSALPRLHLADKRGSSSQSSPDVQPALPYDAQSLEQKLLANDRDETEYVDDDSREELWDEVQPKPIIPAMGAAIQSLLSDPQRLKMLGVKAIKFYAIWYLATTAWKVLDETLKDLTEGGLGTGEPYFCSRSELQRLLLYLEDPSLPVSVPRPIVELAEDLRAAGLPIRGSRRTSIESLFEDLTRAEASILKQCLWKPPPSVRQNPGAMWESVLGLDEVKERLLLTVASSSPDIKPGNNLVRDTQQAYASLLKGTDTSSTSQHHGVLLFGEPGCGKSFLVQALAAKLQWPCLVVTPSVLMRKYVGDTNLQVRALFSLLQSKLSPCIVVLDELDGLFRERHDMEHDASRELKTEFLQWMSGIMVSSGSTDHRHPPIIVGATNRPSDVDSAVLRRLPQRFYIGPPNYGTRCKIFYKMLQDVPKAHDFDVDFLSQRTEGYTPSDIQQVLRTAARGGPLKEAIVFEQVQKQQGSMNPLKGTVRPLTTQDVLCALSHIHATPLSHSYRRDLQMFANLNDGNELDQGRSHQFLQANHLQGYRFVNIGTVEAEIQDARTTFHPEQQPQSQDYLDSEEESLDDYDDEDEDDDEWEL